MRTALLGVMGFLVLTGCGGRSVAGNYNGSDAGTNPADAAVIPDAAVRPDGGIVDCEFRDHWELTAAPLADIVVLNPQYGGNGIPQGVAVRVETTVSFTGCDELAGVQAELHPQDLTVLVAAYVWHYTGDRDCPSALKTGIERFAFPRLPAGNWEIWDYMINGPGVPFYIRDCSAGEDCFCDAWQGIPGDWGAACDFDCMCTERLDCVMDGSGGCYQTCSVTADCLPPLFCNEMLPQTSQGVCLSTGLLDSCIVDTDCAPGYACLPVEGENYNWCRAAMDRNRLWDPCEADCECDPGFSCVKTRPDGTRSCQIRCRGNQDCPRGTRCDSPDPGVGQNLLYCHEE
ncbi:MAG: hypothetical protein ABI333_20430 [bacterium]